MQDYNKDYFDEGLIITLSQVISKITYADETQAFLENDLGEGFMIQLDEEPLKDDITSLMATSESISVHLTFTKLGRYISDIISTTLTKQTKEETVTKTIPVMTRSEVSQRVGQHDCCIIIDKKVYNIASYLSSHPGIMNLLFSNNWRRWFSVLGISCRQRCNFSIQ